LNKSVIVAVAVVITTLLAGAAGAQQYPTKTVRLIIPGSPGGSVDTIGRMIAQRLTDALGQPVLADNRAGAGTMIASELTAKSPPDGHTVLMVSNSHAINAGLYKTLPYDPVKDFAEVTLAALLPYLLVVHPSVPAQNVKELIALARKRPGDLHFASAGSGSSTHLAGELFKSMAGANMTHVPYKGGAPGVTDLLGGHVQAMFNSPISVGQLAKEGRLRTLAISSAKRSALLPQIPTIAESGLPGYESVAWYGMLVPARTPAYAITTLNREVLKILKTNEVRARLATDGGEVIGSTPEEFATHMRNDIQRWTKLIPAIGLQPDK
jgi:tripartite-type tricarboxylate transporter receptor subunit TctC